jgi:four helix bundle protein
MNENKFDFENLRVYQKALDYSIYIYEITKSFPKNETYSLVDQFRRAAVSICLNIAEGSGGSKAEFCQFIKIARRSVRECVACTEIGRRLKFLDSPAGEESRKICIELSMMLNGLIKSLRKYDPQSDPN